MTSLIIARILDFGLLRALLIALAISTLLLAPEPQARTVISWPSIVPTLIAPTIMPLVFLVLILDLIMARVMSAGETSSKKRRHARRVIWIDGLTATAILYVYLPFFLALGR